MISVPQKQNGASILDFLVVLPILFFLMVTAIELGAIFTRANTLTKTVEDATRYLADSSVGKNNTNAQRTIAENLIKYGAVGTGPQLLPGTYRAPVFSKPDANHVRTSVIYDHTPIMGNALNGLIGIIGGNSINLSISLNASSVMRYAQ